MLSIVQALGWPVWPLIISSIVSLALIIERFMSLKDDKAVPALLLEEVISMKAKNKLQNDVLKQLEDSSPLGRVFAAVIRNENAGRAFATEAAVVAGNKAGHDLSKHMALLGSIGSIAPLLGLFGTVVGMIEIFASQQAGANPQQLAQGISLALYSTAFGILIAVPTILCHRHFKNKIDEYITTIEQHAMLLVETLFRRHHPIAGQQPQQAAKHV